MERQLCAKMMDGVELVVTLLSLVRVRARALFFFFLFQDEFIWHQVEHLVVVSPLKKEKMNLNLEKLDLVVPLFRASN